VRLFLARSIKALDLFAAGAGASLLVEEENERSGCV
jgi:hypothetical protein